MGIMASGLRWHYAVEGFSHPWSERPLTTEHPPDMNHCTDYHMIDACRQFAASGIAARLWMICHWTAYKPDINLQPERGSQ